MCIENEESGVAFKGNIEWLPDISVDNFTNKERAAHFLSHVHQDHMKGLLGRPSDLHKISKIYMSKVTKIILKNEYSYIFQRVQSAIKVIETEHYPIKVNGKEVAKVTLLPVTHMPGAVMFLFKTGEKTILFTGDFVMNDQELKKFAQLDSMRENCNPITIDLMYYDATLRLKKNFRNNKNIPERSQCVTEASDKIREWLEADKLNAVAIYKYYGYAYEQLFQGIYDNLDKKEKIHLYNNNQRVVYRQILRENEQVYTDQKSRIHICKDSYNLTDHEQCMAGAGIYNYMHIKVFTFPCTTTAIKTQGKKENNNYILTFPTHSSDRQLTKFLECIKPLEARPFPEQDEVANKDDGGPSTPKKGIKRKEPSKPRKENFKNKMNKTNKKPSKMQPL